MGVAKATRKKPPTRVPATDAARLFGELLSRVTYAGEEFVITRRGRPVAALVAPPRECERDSAIAAPAA